jgi:hypothetical protein
MADRPTLIVIGRADAGLQVADDGGITARSADVEDLQTLFGAEGHRLEAIHPHVDHETLSRHFRVVAPEDRLHELARRLADHPSVEGAYVKPAGNLPVADHESVLLDLKHPDIGQPPDQTPDYVSRQGYLDAAPVGVGALAAGQLPGGRGRGVQVIDCEFGWNFDHEDLQDGKEGVVHGTPTTNDAWTQHGTAVLGIFGGDPSDLGVTGICSEAEVSAVSFGSDSAAAIRWAADHLRAGDILLVELERTLASSGADKPLIAIEWWPDDFAAIRYASDKGVLVVEAAGNGNANLDDPMFDAPGEGFPESWKNPFRRGGPDSGAILVGAGCPPAGTHGRSAWPSGSHAGEVYVDRARCGFSNYGSRLDAQGWGWEVTTTGYGSLAPLHKNNDRWYMDMFNGTSSASPIVLGALACVQGVLHAKSRKPLAPAEARDLLRQTGSPQQNAPDRPATQRIGNRPDIQAMLRELDAL